MVLVWCCCRVVVVLWIVWYLVGWVVDGLRDGEVRERSHGLYPVRNAGFVIAF